MKTETACEGKTLDLRCKKGMTIDIESAIYGRLSSKTCKAGSNIDTTNCASRKSTDKVKQKCNGHRNCNVRVSNWKIFIFTFSSFFLFTFALFGYLYRYKFHDKMVYKTIALDSK
jgi:hypothetical protein